MIMMSLTAVAAGCSIVWFYGSLINMDMDVIGN